MSVEITEEARSKNHMERRVIRVDLMPDQAGIAAALRRAFDPQPAPVLFDEDDPFAALLKQIH